MTRVCAGAGESCAPLCVCGCSAPPHNADVHVPCLSTETDRLEHTERAAADRDPGPWDGTGERKTPRDMAHVRTAGTRQSSAERAGETWHDACDCEARLGIPTVVLWIDDRRDLRNAVTPKRKEAWRRRGVQGTRPPRRGRTRDAACAEPRRSHSVHRSVQVAGSCSCSFEFRAACSWHGTRQSSTVGVRGEDRGAALYFFCIETRS
jgi:hypothetical protein